jgi:prepilin-type N-terminal cleavage/methylation domain-containing protein
MGMPDQIVLRQLLYAFMLLYSNMAQYQADRGLIAMKNKDSAGFTLLEMSLVLLVIGLIIGGMLLGKSLLTTSRLQTVISDADSYITAVANFKQTYQALPGDIPTASSLWGLDSSCGGSTTGTCNGDGNGQIGNASYEYEVFRLWQHLSLAGMFSQHMSGSATTGGVYSGTIGVNLPTGSISGGGFYMVWKGTIGSGDANYYFSGAPSQFFGHTLIFGSAYTNAGTSGPILTADQASSIDSKIDDGVPSTGKVRAPMPSAAIAPSCTVSPSASVYTYNITVSGNLCPVIFITGY